MANGLGEKQIAAEKRIALSTVKDCKRTVFIKLGAVNSPNAVKIGKEQGLI